MVGKPGSIGGNPRVVTVSTPLECVPTDGPHPELGWRLPGRARKGAARSSPKRQFRSMESSRSYPPRALLPALNTAPQPPQAPSPLKLFLCDNQILGGRVGALLRFDVCRAGSIECCSGLLFSLSLVVLKCPYPSTRLPIGIAMPSAASGEVLRVPNRAISTGLSASAYASVVAAAARRAHSAPLRARLLPTRLKPAQQQTVRRAACALSACACAGGRFSGWRPGIFQASPLCRVSMSAICCICKQLIATTGSVAMIRILASNPEGRESVFVHTDHGFRGRHRRRPHAPRLLRHTGAYQSTESIHAIAFRCPA